MRALSTTLPSATAARLLPLGASAPPASRVTSHELFAAALADSLAALVSAASQLPDVEPTDTGLPHSSPPDGWSERYAAVQKTLGDWADYWTTLATHGDDASEAVPLALGDDLADIWRDLKEGLLALEGVRCPAMSRGGGALASTRTGAVTRRRRCARCTPAWLMTAAPRAEIRLD
jgi:hypothetical protein